MSDQPPGEDGGSPPQGREAPARDGGEARHEAPRGLGLSPSRLFILRPIATSLLMIAIFLAGVVGFQFLPLSALPEVDYPTIQVQTFYPGASPDVTTSQITAPLERQFGQMPSLNRMSSVSSGGASIITLQFGLEISLDVAEQEVQAAINAAGNLLPSDLPAPPVYAKVNPADAPILTVALTSKTLPLTQVEDLADTRLAQKISQVAGVGLVTVSGGQRPAVRIQANPTALASYGLTLEALRTAISAANVNGAKGALNGPVRTYTLNANDQLSSPQDYAALVIAYRNGAPIRLGDVASVVNGAENTQLSALSNTTPAIILNVQRQPGANVIAVVDRVKALLPELTQSLPAGVDVSVTSDRTVTIRSSVHDVEFELALSIALVVAVIFVFLRNLAATAVSAIAVPLSLVGAFGAMYLLHYSLNNLTLMALTIATGFVVDDAIVMIENIARHVEEGQDGRSAALQGSGEIGFTIISLTLSLLAVLIPLLFMADVVGRLFREFAVTLAATILVSAFVSLTLVPTLCALWLRRPRAPRPGSLNQRLEDGFNAIIRQYDKGLTWAIAHRPTVLIAAVATFAATVLLFLFIPKGLFPTQDTGAIQGVVEASQSASYASMADRQRQIAEQILRDPAVANVASFVGVDAQNQTVNTGRVLIELKPLGQRPGAAEVIRRLNREIQAPGVQVYLQPVQDLTIDTTVSRTQYQFVLQGADPALLSTWTPRLIDALKRVPEVEGVASDVQNQGLAVYIQVDRDTAGRLGVSMASVDNLLYDAFGQRIVSTIFTQSNQFRVILEAAPEFQQGVDALNNLYLQSASGGTVPLAAIAKVVVQTTPLQISHVGQFPAATVSFNLARGASLGGAVGAIRRAEQSIGMPSAIDTTFLGAAQAFEASLSNELWLVLAAVVAIYIVLGVLYESFIHPITILSTLPSAAVGALLALLLAGQELGVIGIIGIVLLIGIVNKNAILMIDFALDAERNQGLPAPEAIHQAALLRFRPILMTTMAALLSAVPLWLGGGIGAELRRPLGIAIIGGLIASQLLTLFTTPVIYIAFDGLASRFGRKDREGPARGAHGGPARGAPEDNPPGGASGGARA